MKKSYNYGSNYGSSEQLKKKRKRKLVGDKRSNRKTWTSEEVSGVLEYLRNTMLTVGQIEKPTARAYYNQMLDDVNIDNCDAIGLNNKVRKLRESFWKAVQLKEELRLGGGSDAYIREEILKQCENYDMLEEIYGSSVTYIDKKPVISSMNIDNFSDSEYEDIFENDSSLGDPLAVESIHEPVEPTINITSSAATSNTTTIANSSQISKQSEENDSSVEHVLGTKKEDEVRKGDIEWEKLLLENEKLQFSKELRLKQMNLDERKCATQELSAKAEIDFRKELLAFEREKFFKEKELELEKFKIEQNMKYELELAKIKNKV